MYRVVNSSGPSTEPCDLLSVSTEDIFTCKTPAVADIVILVDGSWSIGRINFRLVRMFLESLVRAFAVGSEHTRVGLAQYSGDPRVEWHLNTHSTKEAVINAVKNLPYKGGNTLTGLALTYILENSFKPESGSRPEVPKIGILITDGKSQDDVLSPAQRLRDAGIELFAIGVKNADENELRAIASPPEDTHMYNVADFSVMSSIVEGVTRSVCERVSEISREISGGFWGFWDQRCGFWDQRWVLGVLGSAVGSEGSGISSGFWDQRWVLGVLGSADQPWVLGVLGSAVGSGISVGFWGFWDQLWVLGSALGSGGSGISCGFYISCGFWDQRWVLGVLGSVVGSVSAVSSGISGGFWDQQWILGSVVGSVLAVGSGISGETEPHSRSLDAPSDLVTSEVTARSFRVSWTHAAGPVEKYRVVYYSSSGVRPEEVVVNGDENSVVLRHLNSLTEYQITVFAIYSNSASEALRGIETTLALPTVSTLELYDITHSTMRVKVSDSVTQIELEGLTPATEYTVTVYAMYGEEASDPMTAQETTLRLTPARNLRILDVNHSSAKLSWDAASRKVKGYRIVYVKTDAVQTNQVEVGPVTTVMLRNLSSETEYTVAILALYEEGQAEALTDTFRVTWKHAASDVSYYRLTWRPAAGGETKEVLINDNSSWFVITGLKSLTEYEVSLSGIYSDESESDPVEISQTTGLTSQFIRISLSLKTRICQNNNSYHDDRQNDYSR
ncbi:unnamed protein product [Leuciscus chuanchicus]